MDMLKQVHACALNFLLDVYNWCVSVWNELYVIKQLYWDASQNGMVKIICPKG